jgi:hypothetical protein
VPPIVEWARKPHLIIRVLDDPPDTRHTRRFLHCWVINDPHHRFFWLIDRNPAYNTRVTLTFFRGDQRFLGPIDTKWVNAPSCLAPVVQLIFNQSSQPPQINTISAFDETKTVLAHEQTIPSDERGRAFDVVLKYQGQSDCYAFTGWSFQFPSLSDPALAVPQGEFKVEMKAIASNAQSETTNVVLRNTGLGITDVTIESI